MRLGYVGNLEALDAMLAVPVKKMFPESYWEEMRAGIMAIPDMREIKDKLTARPSGHSLSPCGMAVYWLPEGPKVMS